MVNIENIVDDKKYIIRKKNVITKYTKFCEEDNCKEYAYYNYPYEKIKLYCR